MKKLMAIGSGFIALALLMTSFGLTAQAAAPTVNVTGSYVIDMDYLGSSNLHDMSLTQDGLGNLTGNGGSPAGANTYMWTITSGSVSGNSIDFLANYTATPDAVTPQTVLHVIGTVAANGTMSGTWSDNYNSGSRSGTWTTTSGSAALLGSLAAEDFGVVNYDTGLGILKGYTAGFGVADNTFAGATNVQVKLYAAGDQLLQTNTAILAKFNLDVTGIQFSSPFDVSGDFDYAADGYWANARETQYGQSIPATKVVATVTLANGKIVTATNTNLTGDATTIYPAATHTITASTGVNGSVSPLGAIVVAEGNNQAFTITANSGYQIDDVLVDGSSVGALSTYTFLNVLANHTISASFELEDQNPNGPQGKDECKNGGWKTFTTPSFKNQGQCVSWTNHQ